MNLPQNERGSAESTLSAGQSEQVEVRFKLPRYLRDELHEVAARQTITLSSLMRIMALEFVRIRHDRKGEDE